MTDEEISFTETSFSKIAFLMKMIMNLWNLLVLLIGDINAQEESLLRLQ